MDISRHFIGEHSAIEYLHLLILVCLAIAMGCAAWLRRRDRDALFSMAAGAFGLLVAMAGREFSFGKYHGIEHEFRTLARNTVHLAMVGLWIYAAFRIWPTFGETLRQALALLRANYRNLVAAIVIITISQIVDKDWIIAIQPPELSAVVEESLETVAYGFLAAFLYRLFRSQKGVESAAAAKQRTALSSRVELSRH